jgi:hypothetical protein
MGRARGFLAANRRDVVMASVREYRKRMRAAAAKGTLDAWYDHLEVGVLLDQVRREVERGRLSKREARGAQQLAAKARTRDSVRLLTKRAGRIDGELKIVAEPPLIVPVEDLVEPGSEWEDTEGLIKRQLASYRETIGEQHHPLEEFRYVHVARKVVGVGSVGTRCYIVLLAGRDDDDPLFLQVKEAGPSVLERVVGPSHYDNHGERVVAGQRLLQAASDIFLGWQRIKGLDGLERDYYIRQLHDWKGGADADGFLVPGATVYARLCGATLARAHARWGDRIAIASYLGKSDRFDAAVADFSVAYADQNERDYEAVVDAARSGRIPAHTDL